MSQLSDYRASIERLLEAEDTDRAFQDEGTDERITALVAKSKSFRAVRAAIRDSKATRNVQAPKCRTL